MSFTDLIKAEFIKIEEADAAEAQRAKEEALKRQAAIAAELLGFEEWKQLEDGDRRFEVGANCWVKLLRTEGETVTYTLQIISCGIKQGDYTHPESWAIPSKPPTPEEVARIIAEFLWRRSLKLPD